MYHIYENGYSVLPSLYKLGKNAIFQVTTNDFDRYILEKQIASKTQTITAEFNLSEEINETISNFIVKNYPLPLKEPFDFFSLGYQMQEDLAIHRMDEKNDWLAAAHVSFPSGWRPEEKIGRSFEEIHVPIPGFNLKTSRKLAETMIYSGPFERYVWGLSFEDRINGHPNIPKKPFDINNPVIFVKIERQITIGFPELSAALFVIRQFLIKEQDINKPLLVKALQSMNEDQRKYKGLVNIEPVIEYLKPPKIDFKPLY
jgi:hypothetical protein